MSFAAVSVSACLVGQTAESSAPISLVAKLPRSEPSQDDRGGSARLVDKLASSGQLKAGFLLRVLQQGQIELFELGFAHLLGLDSARLSRVLYEGGPRLLALACRAAAIDRAVFPTVYSLSRRSRRMPHLLEADDRLDAFAVFETYSKAEALALLLAV
jgi:uncharacterized protein (DUF2336 family)